MEKETIKLEAKMSSATDNPKVGGDSIIQWTRGFRKEKYEQEGFTLSDGEGIILLQSSVAMFFIEKEKAENLKRSIAGTNTWEVIPCKIIYEI